MGANGRRIDRDRAPRMRVLVVLSSSNQMYSGIGRAVFELARRLEDRVAFEFAIDDGVRKNVDLVARFGEDRGMPVHVGRSSVAPDALDRLNVDLPDLLADRRWDLVEALCWANAATNDALLAALGDLPLAYTPHDQPAWTVPMSAAQGSRTEAVHRRMVERADVVLCDSLAERRALQRLAPRRENCVFIPLGCDFRAFAPGGWPRREQVLFVGDLAEPRKRFDRVLSAFARLAEDRPGLRLVVVGNRSDEAAGLIPEGLRDRCDLKGYIGEDDLRRLYAESLGLLLLSDFEAFGIPILESLASGTPVFISRQEATTGLFGPFRGAHVVPAEDPDATHRAIAGALDRGRDLIDEIARDRGRLAATFDWDGLADRKWDALRAAWADRRRWAIPA